MSGHDNRVTLVAWTFGSFHEEVFKDEAAFAALQRSAAVPAGNLALSGRRCRIDANEFVLGAAVGAVERCCRRAGRHS